jgi:hypothetical protein
LKNVKRYFSRPEWMKKDEEILEEEVSSEEEMDEEISEDIEQDQTMSQSEISEIFDTPTTQNLISPANIEEPGNFEIGVEVEVFRKGQWIPGTIQKIRKQRKAVEARIVGPRINAWHKLHSNSIRKPT